MTAFEGEGRGVDQQGDTKQEAAIKAATLENAHRQFANTDIRAVAHRALEQSESLLSRWLPQAGSKLSVARQGRRPESPCGGARRRGLRWNHPSAAKDDLIDRTIELWQPRLRPWSKAKIARAANDIRYQPDRSSAATPDAIRRG